MDKPLDPHLNAAVVSIANRLMPCGWDVSPHAPATYDALVRHWHTHRRICVFDGGSDHTIFADAGVNHAFRAWHDWVHVKHGYDFSMNGEVLTCSQQIQHLNLFYGVSATTIRWAKLLDAEIVGQKQYHEITGEFPVDQMAFDLAWVSSQNDALLRRF